MKLTRQLFLLAALLYIQYHPLFAQDSTLQRMSLKACVQYAKQNNNSNKNALLAERIAHQQVRQTRAQGLPQIDAASQFTDFTEIPVTSVPGSAFGQPNVSVLNLRFGTHYAFQAGVTLNQLIFDGRYFVGLKASKVYEQLSQYNLTRNEIDIASSVTKAYYAVLVNRISLQLTRSNMAVTQKTLSDTKAQFESGISQKTDVDRIQVNVNNLESQEQNQMAQVALSETLLKFQMGMPLKNKIELTDTVNTTAAGVAGVNLNLTRQELDYQKRIEYKSLTTQKLVDSYNLKQIKAGFLPTLNFVANLNTVRNQGSFEYFAGPYFASNYYGFKFAWNLFDGLSKVSQVQQARLTLEQDRNNLANEELAIDQDYANARTTFDNAMRTLEIQKRNADLAADVYKITQLQYAQGVASNLQLVTDENSLVQAQSNYVSALLNVYTAQVDLKKALGVLETE